MSSLDRALPGGPRSPKYYQALAASPDTPPEVLREVATKDFSFVAEALAGNPSTPPDVLRTLVPTVLVDWNAIRCLELLARNPQADGAVLEACAAKVTEALSQHRDRGHPYGAALALAGRPEVSVEATRAWLTLPGASSRFRQHLQSVIDARTAVD